MIDYNQTVFPGLFPPKGSKKADETLRFDITGKLNHVIKSVDSNTPHPDLEIKIGVFNSSGQFCTSYKAGPEAIISKQGVIPGTIDYELQINATTAKLSCGTYKLLVRDGSSVSSKDVVVTSTVSF